MDYEDYFNKSQALKDFDLDVEEYIVIIEDIDDFMCVLMPMYKCFIQKPKKVIEILQKEKEKYKIMCENPTALTIEDRQKIRDIREYAKSQSSLNYDFKKYRRERTEEVVDEYKKIALKNRMFMLANQAEIDAEIDKIIAIYQRNYKIKREEYNAVRQKDIRDWQSQYYGCVCGLQIQRVNKARHEKTKSHQEYIKALNPDAELKESTYDWHKQKYTCYCGKVVSKGNKYTHENTKYHKQYCNKTTCHLIIEDEDEDKTLNKKEEKENIILTIGEKSVSADGNEEFSADDDAFKYF